ncbi:PREDICTED: putative nuclease HARBI1 [Rhagoletis zephyria]|uniref:putative nuclease HARBI1 n=1 Tax=Rhagoletis zephyria TaxID=28612 RepID=UPI000811A885|nr:PREDICTED: putative nuclease HARBI1 [Rhagoletis zephyria]
MGGKPSESTFELGFNNEIANIPSSSEAENAVMDDKENRASTFWEVECQCCGDDFFKHNFRLKRRAFQKLCSFLDHIKKKETNFQNSICLEKRVAIALYALGSSAEYRSIANLFGVGKSTVCTILSEFCKEVWKVLHPGYFNYFPLSRKTIEECVDGFKSIGFPQCLGTLDGCHIEIRPRTEEAVDYINYKGWYSTVLQALVAYIFSPGRCNDSQIFEKSSLKRELEKCSLLYSMSTKLGNFDIPVVILGDSAFRFSKYLMKPFPFSLDKTPAQKTFNYQLSKSRRVVENAFGQLKARFRRIGKGIDNRIDNANSIIKTCCALHNFLIAENDQVSLSWLTEQNANDSSRRQPQSADLHQSLIPCPHQSLTTKLWLLSWLSR